MRITTPLAVGVGLLAGVIAAAVVVVGPDASPRSSLTVHAAASLSDAFAELLAAYRAEQPGRATTLATDASSALRARIEEGAAADVFASADLEQPRALVAAGHAAGPVVPFAANRLTIAVPADNPAGLSRAADLARPGIRILAAAEAVPIRRYADEAIARLAELPGYPPDFARRVAANVVSREDNVRAVVAKLALGEADAAFVYVTDVDGDAVRAIGLPDTANVRVLYGAVVPRTAAQPDDGAAFVRWLLRPAARGVLARHGFLPP